MERLGGSGGVVIGRINNDEALLITVADSSHNRPGPSDYPCRCFERRAQRHQTV